MFIKALGPIDVTLSGMFKVTNSFFIKLPIPIVVIPSGIVIDFKAFPKKATSSISFIDFGSFTEVNFLFAKALLPIDVTFCPLIVSGITISVSVPIYLVILPSENSKSLSSLISPFLTYLKKISVSPHHTCDFHRIRRSIDNRNLEVMKVFVNHILLYQL